MRLLFVADIHYSLRQMAWMEAVAVEFDAVLIAGDLLDVAGHAPLPEQRARMGDALLRIADRAPVLVASGNHDVDGSAGEAAWLDALAGPRLFTDGSTVAWQGVAVSLWPWSAARRVGERIVRRPHLAACTRAWIWVHHMPPAGTRVAKGRRGAGPGGSKRLAEQIRHHRPSLVLSGHLHDAPFLSERGWWDEIGSTVIVNPGRQHGDMPAHIICDFEAERLFWTSGGTRDDRAFGTPSALAGVA